MNRLSKIRKLRGLSQLQVANDLAITPATYSRYESGDRNPPNEMLIKLADYFSVSADYLLGIDDAPHHETTFRWVPLRDGLPAGPLSETDDYVIGYVEVPENRYSEMPLEAVKVKGDSMAPRIMDGDIVIFRPQAYAETGDIVVVRINCNEYTLKKFKKMDNGIMLIPANPKYDPMFYTSDQVGALPVEIIGVVVELRSQF